MPLFVNKIGIRPTSVIWWIGAGQLPDRRR
jgi:hypothetical protein